MKKTLVFLIFTCLLCGQIFASDTLRLAGPGNDWLPEYLSEFKDCSKEETASSLLRKFKKNQFSKVEKGKVSNVINRGLTHCVHWFALVVKNESDRPQDYLWNFYNEGINFTLYEADLDTEKILNEESLSHHISRVNRSVPLRSISFKVSMMPGETKTLLVKTEPIGRKNLYFPTDISTEADILWWELDFSFLLGRYYGFFFFAAIFNFCLFIILRKRFFGDMLGYVLSLLAFTMVEYLHDLYLIPESVYPYWAKIPRVFFLGLALYFNIRIFQDFVQFKKYLPKFDKYLRIIGNTSLVIAYLFLLIHFFNLLSVDLLQLTKVYYNVFLLVQLVVFLIGIIVAIKKKIAYVWHYLGGNSLIFISVILYILNNTFEVIHHRQFINPGNLIFAFAFEVVYLMIVFALKYKNDFDQFTLHLKKAEQERILLTSELISTQEKERMRVAQDIHDGIGGSLQAFRMLLGQEKLQNEEKLNTILKTINSDFKHLIHQLSPKNLKTLGLFPTIEDETSRFGDSPSVELNLIGDESLLPWEMKINVYRIYQELTTNALKHAENLNALSISIAIDLEEIRLMVEDNGKQKISIEEFEKTDGFGISNIRTRVAYYNGCMHIDNTTQGTSIIINLPLKTKTYD